MSHKICGKNIEREKLRAEFAELLPILENPDVEHSQYDQVKVHFSTVPARLAKVERHVASECPMCNRIFYVGDALCNCAPAIVEKPGTDGKPVKVMRVTGMYNRHTLRKMVCKGARQQKHDNLILKQHAVFEAVKNAQRMSPAEWTRQSMAAKRKRLAFAAMSPLQKAVAYAEGSQP